MVPATTGCCTGAGSGGGDCDRAYIAADGVEAVESGTNRSIRSSIRSQRCNPMRRLLRSDKRHQKNNLAFHWESG